MTETPSEPKIRIEHLTKIFKAQSKEALKLLHDGFEAGLGIVIVAIILDRVLQHIGSKKR